MLPSVGNWSRVGEEGREDWAAMVHDRFTYLGCIISRFGRHVVVLHNVVYGSTTSRQQKLRVIQHLLQESGHYADGHSVMGSVKLLDRKLCVMYFKIAHMYQQTLSVAAIKRIL